MKVKESNPLYWPLYHLLNKVTHGGINGNPYAERVVTDAILALTNGASKYDLPTAKATATKAQRKAKE